MVPLVAGDGEGEEAAGDAASFDPQCIPAWEAAKLAVMRRSTRAGAGDTSTDGIVGMARIARIMVVLLSLLTLLASCPAGWGANVGHSIEWLSYSVSLYSLTYCLTSSFLQQKSYSRHTPIMLSVFSFCTYARNQCSNTTFSTLFQNKITPSNPY
jgi:hypothetical protein